MQEAETENWYWYKLTGQGEICLYRVFGTLPEVSVPETLFGKTVTGLGSYCFSETEKAGDFRVCSDTLMGQEAEVLFQKLLLQKKIRCLCGEYLEKVSLPKSMKAIGNCCFYRCSRLTGLTVGNGLSEIGSDAFMNCIRLREIVVLGGVTEPSGLKQILGQRPLETRAEFIAGQETEAVLLYPEYSETYDEIGPAHIFELNIAGEGFRARQCFREGVVDLAQYDTVFVQAQAGESVRTLCYMAGFRLFYPAGLKEESKQRYEDYLKENAMQVMEVLVKEQDLKMLQFFGEEGYLGSVEMKKGAQLAASGDWTEGAALLLQMQQKWHGSEKKKKYSFDAF